MTERKCARKDCNRQAISNSRFCGQHTNNKEFNQKLNKLTRKDLKNLHWDELEIKKVKLPGKRFTALLLTNTDLTAVVFTECIFNGCNFQNITFTNCRFDRCKFEQAEFTDVTFHEAAFEGCTIVDSRFSEVLFADETVLQNTQVEDCILTGGMFSETGTSAQSTFLRGEFIQVSFNQARFNECQFIETTFTKSSIYDSVFTACYFDTITHDFALTGVPMLTDFRGTRFVNMSIPKNLRKWSNLKKAPLDFYLGIVDSLVVVNHPNYLPELAVALDKLLQLGYSPDSRLNHDVKALFKRLAASAAATGDYRTLGDILSDFGRLPYAFRQGTGFMLPPAKSGNDNALDEEARLTIHAQSENWQLQKITRFLSLLSQLEAALPEGPPQTLSYLENGSIIVQVIGGIKQLFTGFMSLLDAKKATMDIKLKGLEYQLKELDVKKAEIDLQHYERMKVLEYDTAKLSQLEQKLDILKKFQELTGVDYAAYLKTPNGQNAQNLSDLIQKEFPVFHLEITDKP